MSRSARILVAELLGTMILILGGPGTVIFGQFIGFQIGVLGVAFAFGLSLLCAAYLFGHISGCHINPAVTIGMWVLKRTPSRELPAYFVGQILGALIGGALIWAIVETGDNGGGEKLVRNALFSGASNGYGSHSPGKFELGSVIIAEVLFTALFVLVILGTTRTSMVPGFAAIPIGLMLTLVHMISIPIDNTSVNPVRSLSTAVFADSWAIEQIWVFIVFPIIGGLIAAGIWIFVSPAGRHLSVPTGANSIVRALRVTPGKVARLSSRDPGDRLGLGKREEEHGSLETLSVRLDDLHNRLWAEAKRSVLLVLQGMDAAGKDGTIRRVLSGLNPQGCDVVNFKQPSPPELADDYLWRVHATLPARGILGVMNRSHYEDVVIARIAGIIDDDHQTRRFRHIREFERMLTDEGTTLVKVFLHISKEEQRERLQARIDNPEKNWKFHSADLEVRAKWDEYQERYEQAISATSTSWAPWYVVPGDHKWVRDVAVATILVDVFGSLDPQIPEPEAGLDGVIVE